MTRTWRLAAVTIAACFLTFSPAYALSHRVWVSGHGTDSPGCGAPTAPCRSLQYAVSNVVADGGEIDVLDPAGYGAVTITHALSIVNDGVGTAGVQAAAGDVAISILAGPTDNIVLRGLAIDGAGVGAIGIVFGSGGSLTVSNCVVQNFVGASDPYGSGIYLRPTSGTPKINILNTTVSNNSYVGLYYLDLGSGGARLTIDHLAATNNQYGVTIDTFGGIASTKASVLNSLASNNSSYGFYFLAANTQTQDSHLDSSFSSDNGAGIRVDGQGAFVVVSRTLTHGNSPDLSLNNAANVFSSGDNLILSGSDFPGVFTHK